MIKDALATLGSRYVLIGGFTLTAVGVMVALKEDLPWIAFCLLLPLTIASLSCAWTSHNDACKSRAVLTEEMKRHMATKERAEQAATKALQGIKSFLRQYALGYTVDTIRRSVQCMNRMCQVHQSWGHAPSVIRFTRSQSQLFAAVKLPEEAVVHVRENDAFVLVQAGKERIRHTVAMLRVNQPPNIEKKSLILRVDSVFNDETVDALSSLAEVSDQRPSGFIVELPFDPEPFSHHDFAAAESLLATMHDHLNELYLEEVVNV